MNKQQDTSYMNIIINAALSICLFGFIVICLYQQDKINNITPLPEDTCELKLNANNETVCVKDGFQYKKPEDVKAEINQIDYWDTEEGEKEKEEIEKNIEESRQRWLNTYPPVDELFDITQIYNNEYVIKYLQRNKISGDCALILRKNVICIDSEKISFPHSRFKRY